jgi:predicted ATPase
LDNTVEQSLFQYTEQISVYEHRLIAGISTNDVQQLLTRKYADAAEQSNKLHLGLTNKIIAAIKKHKTGKQPTTLSAAQLNKGERVLNDIHRRIEKVNSQREVVMKPFSVLEETFKGVFHHKGIRLSEAIVFGEKNKAVRADQLSAGEKQMLSFLTYNAFTRNAIFFIDEPEISLHADWQRQLFRLLLKQETGNQFIAATHSPFIYSKYPEKEHPLTLEKGE